MYVTRAMTPRWICRERCDRRCWRGGRGRAWCTGRPSRESLPPACGTRGSVVARGSTCHRAESFCRRGSCGRRMDVPRASFLGIPQLRSAIGSGLQKGGIGDFAILNPGAGWGAKRWPAERYGERGTRAGRAKCAIDSQLWSGGRRVGPRGGGGQRRHGSSDELRSRS
jgi:hypothetical protein